MSELTSYNSERIYWAVEQVEQKAGDVDDLHLDDNLFYLKSEVDTAIANRDYEIKELIKSIGKLLKVKTEQVMDEVFQRCLIYGEGFVPVEHAMRLVADIRHQKYKRCLAMARWCKECSWSKCIENVEFYYKWYNRWLELAKKFKDKEAK